MFKKGLIAILCIIHSWSFADNYTSATLGDSEGLDTLNTIKQYLRNLGGYLGYPLDSNVDPNKIWSQLLGYSKTPSTTASFQKIFEQFSYFTLFGATPVNAMNYPTFSTFTDNNYAQLNAWANLTFSDYNSPNSGSSSSSNPRVDQQNNQPDPVNQSILNSIGIPDPSICTQGPSTSCAVSASNCISQNSVMEYILGDVMSDGALLGPTEMYSPNTGQKIIGSLNTNNLIAPLVYSTGNGSSSNNTNDNTPQGLPSSTQEQQAGNFIRYALGTLSETQMIKYDDYNNIWQTAYAKGCDSNNYQAAMDARKKLENYFTSMRMFGARTSVAASNLYYMFSKRIRQQPSNESNTNSSSQALSEFQMASWRLYNPQNDQNNQWVDQINHASSATVQKEIAVLLSEINYQLYLSRQQQERLLLTNTMLLLQSLGTTKPTPPTNESSADS